jgi:hypothetical protein
MSMVGRDYAFYRSTAHFNFRASSAATKTPQAVIVLRAASNKSLDASGGSVSRNLLRPAEGALIRAAASTQPFDALSMNPFAGLGV